MQVQSESTASGYPQQCNTVSTDVQQKLFELLVIAIRSFSGVVVIPVEQCVQSVLEAIKEHC